MRALLTVVLIAAACASSRPSTDAQFAGAWRFSGTIAQRAYDKEVLRGIEGTIDFARGTLETADGSCNSSTKCGDLEVVLQPSAADPSAVAAHVRLWVEEVVEKRGQCLEWARPDRVTCINWAVRAERARFRISGTVPAWRVR